MPPGQPVGRRAAPERQPPATMGIMTGATALRDGLEALFVVAVGGMVVSAITRIRRGQIRAVRCEHCGRATSNAYPNCRACHLPRSG